MRNVLLSVLVSYLLSSCVKENNNNSNNISRVTINAGNYRTSDTLYDTPPILYTWQAETTDQHIIKDFLNRHNASDSITFNSFEINNNPVTFHFPSDFSFPIEPHNPDPTQVSFDKSQVSITNKTDVRFAIINGIRVKYANPLDSSTIIELKRTDDSIPFFRVSNSNLVPFVPDTVSNFYWLTLEEFRELPYYVIGCPITIGYQEPDTSDYNKCFYFHNSLFYIQINNSNFLSLVVFSIHQLMIVYTRRKTNGIISILTRAILYQLSG